MLDVWSSPASQCTATIGSWGCWNFVCVCGPHWFEFRLWGRRIRSLRVWLAGLWSILMHLEAMALWSSGIVILVVSAGTSLECPWTNSASIPQSVLKVESWVCFDAAGSGPAAANTCASRGGECSNINLHDKVTWNCDTLTYSYYIINFISYFHSSINYSI